MSFELRNGPEVRAQVLALAALLALCALGLLLRDARGPGAEAAQVLVEVGGEVPRPGLYALPAPARVADALRAAGADPAWADPAAMADGPVVEGTRLELVGGAVSVVPMKDPLVLGRPVDLNAADAELLVQIPGIGPARAAAIVADRVQRGPFESVEALDRVKGFGPATVAAVRPFLAVATSSPR